MPEPEPIQSQTQPKRLGEWIIAYHVYGRSTGMGAYTSMRVKKVLKGEARVKRYNYSRTGNHWEEALLVKPDTEAIVYVTDISNSGKHYCYVLHVVVDASGNVTTNVVAEAAGGLCPIHDTDDP